MSGRFRGGTHPDDKKALSVSKPIVALELPDEVVIPMSQHIGAPCAACVEKGQTVAKGQVVGNAQGFVSVPVHSSVCGEVTAVEPRPHFMGGLSPAVVIKRGDTDRWAEGCDQPGDLAGMSADDIRNRILENGLVGMGGATFPTHVKLSPPSQKQIDVLVINGVECEPYLTADDRLMREQPQAVIDGIGILQKVLGVERVVIGIEANKPEAVKLMSEKIASRQGWSVETLPVMYPQGGEKQLISATVDRQVPSGGLPMDIGVVVHNVGTCAAVADAVLLGRPLIERVVTVTGEALGNPGNFLVRIGTRIQTLLDVARVKPTMRRLILGGPMMGLAQCSPDVPVTKGTSGVLCLEGNPQVDYRDCIRCGRCLDGCPAGLRPSLLSVQLEARQAEAAAETNIMDCMECGVCAYVCPSKRPIVHWIKWGKAEMKKRKK